MKVIVRAFEVDKIGNWVRLCDYGQSDAEYGRYLAECAPMCIGGAKPHNEEWGCFGGSVGYGTAQFKRKRDGISFVTDIPKLTWIEMRDRWAPKIGNLPLWDAPY